MVDVVWLAASCYLVCFVVFGLYVHGYSFWGVFLGLLVFWFHVFFVFFSFAYFWWGVANNCQRFGFLGCCKDPSAKSVRLVVGSIREANLISTNKLRSTDQSQQQSRV